MESLILNQSNDFGLNLFLELVSDVDEALLKPRVDRRAIYFLNKPAMIHVSANFRFPLKMIARVHLQVSFLAFLELQSHNFERQLHNNNRTLSGQFVPRKPC